MWVAIDDLKRHTCPSVKCGIVGRFFFRESIVAFETVNGWSRISHYQSAGCYDGESLYIESGSRACSADNGIRQGEFAEWVRSEFLSKERPDKPMDRPAATAAEG